MKQLVSIVIPCYNEEEYIEECLSSLINNDYPSKEFIAVDGDSSDRTAEILERIRDQNPGLVILNNPKKITPVSMNMGIKEAKGEFVMIASAHSSYPEKYLSEIISHYTDADDNIALIGGIIRTIAWSSSKKTSSITKVLSNRWGVGNALYRTGYPRPAYVDTVNYGIYRAKILREFGGFNENLVRNQDIELNKRIIRSGNKILLVPSVSSNYYARETYQGLGQNNYRNGLWILKTFFITGDLQSLSLRHFIPMVFLCSIIFPILTYILTGFVPLLFLSVIIVLAYLLLILFQSNKICDQSTTIRHLLIAFIVLHISYGLGSIVGVSSIGNIFKGRQKKRSV